MRPKTHADLMRFRQIMFNPGVAFILFFFTACLVFGRFYFIFFAWLGYLILLSIFKYTNFPWGLPVHCETPGCVGTLEKVMIYKTNDETELQYKCPSCGSFYETTVQMRPPGTDNDTNIPGEW